VDHAIPDTKTVYLNLKVYPDSSTFKRVSKEMFDLIDAGGAKRLIIDLRQSNGGDFFKFRSHILDGLKSRSAFRLPNSIFIVIGRGTISAAMVNAIETRDQLRAILVGEPTGSKPNSYSENDSLTLPNSKLKVSYSTKFYKLQTQETASLEPDKRIESSWELYTAGRDPAIEWILAQP
jgi:C-terminal processing protease CtpA/Prc